MRLCVGWGALLWPFVWGVREETLAWRLGEGGLWSCFPSAVWSAHITGFPWASVTQQRDRESWF